MRTGRPRKPPERAQGHREHVALALVPSPAQSEVRFLPPAPEGIEKEIAADWVDFWTNGPVKLVDWEHHKRAFCRLYRLYSEALRLEKLTDGREIVSGSQGQDVLNPALRQLGVVRHQILELEQQFGLTPRAGVTLGIKVGGLQQTLADLNREANEHAHRAPARRKARGARP